MGIQKISFIEPSAPGLHIFSKFPIPRLGKAGKKVDTAMEKVGDQLEKAGDKVEQATDKVNQ
ncbi:MAG: hypothetical protein K9N10_14115 [Deltaproteobacteria bacterium]|nr:hypothetical protein [Deltaproteobacteria bacterium]